MPRSSARTVLLLLAALVAFGATTVVVGRLLGPIPGDELDDKFAHLEQFGHEYNALILGASGTFHGIDPVVFDAQLEAVRPGWKSFNLGARGMLGLETDAVLRRALPLMGERLELVVLEPKPFHPWTYRGADEIARVQRWHTPRQTWRALLLSLEHALDRETNSLRWAWQHVRTGARRIGNYGSGERLMAGLTGANPLRFVEPETLLERRGYLPIETFEPPDAPRRRRRFTEDLSAYQAAVAGMLQTPIEPVLQETLPIGAIAGDLVAGQRAWLEGLGLQVLYLMPPYVRRGQFEQILDAARGYPAVIQFADPDRFLELFEPAARLDAQHLNAAAAARLSELAGQAVAERLAAGPNAESEQ